MPIDEIIAIASLAASLLGSGTNVALYIHLSGRVDRMAARFDARFEKPRSGQRLKASKRC
jgi:hypothetical protein